MSVLLGSAFILGLIGNLHCLGMCGPLALAIPLKKQGGAARLFGVSLYNAGRILTYAVFGAAMGLLGRGFQLVGFQQNFSVVLGGLIIFGVLVPFAFKRANLLNTSLFAGVAKLKTSFGKLLQRRSYGATFTLGLLNGLLPCGMVYMALAGAAVAGSWQVGASYMALFGIGTLPVMFLLPYLGQLLDAKIKLRFRKVVPIAMFVFGALLVLRGANLGIPYISPMLNTTQPAATLNCH